MNKKVWKRAVAGVVSLAVFGTVLTVGWKMVTQRAKASEPDRTVSPGYSGLASPSQPEDGAAWSGDYVYYGSYEGEPIRWRVLDISGDVGNSSAEGGILLQSDRILAEMPFEDGEDSSGEHRGGTIKENVWDASDVRAWLRSRDGFLSDENFTESERAGIMKTSAGAGGSPVDMLQGAGLSRDTMFLLDASDLGNDGYGYICKDGVSNVGIKGSWWLRSAHAKYGTGVGCVLPGGYLFHNYVFEEDGGVVPAFNLDPSNILFMTRANQPAGGGLYAVETAEVNEWKLTLLERQKTVEPGTATRHEAEITVPYAYTGTDANQISIMITDGNYGESGTKVKYYGKVSEGNVKEEGTVTFNLPEAFDEERDQLYMLAEQVNEGNRTNYASEPVRFGIPPRHTHEWAWRYDEEYHWKECVAQGCDLTPDAARIDFGEHDFGENEPVLIKEPTSEEDGIEEILCDICGNKIQQEVPYEEPGEEDPDEEDPGEDDPGEEDPDEEEHEFAEKIIRAATCTETGIKRIYCTDEDCEESRDEIIPALSPTLTHTFGDWAQASAPTVQKEGVSKRTCTVCGVYETKSIPKLVPPHQHKYDEYTLTADAKNHWSQCACGAKKDVEPHEWDSGKVLKKPTKKAVGVMEYSCEVCGVKEKRNIEKIGQKFNAGVFRYQVTACRTKGPVVKMLGFAEGKTAKNVTVAGKVARKKVKYTVTEIGRKAFEGELGIEKVVIGDSVEKIGDLAFFLADHVKSFTVGTGLKEFGDHTFCYAYRLKTIVIRSKKLSMAPTGILHGCQEDVVVKVPKKKLEEYQKEVFYTHPENVAAIK